MFQASFQISKNSDSSYLTIYKDKYGTLALFSLIDAFLFIGLLILKVGQISLENLLPQSPEHILLACNMTSPLLFCLRIFPHIEVQLLLLGEKKL